MAKRKAPTKERRATTKAQEQALMSPPAMASTGGVSFSWFSMAVVHALRGMTAGTANEHQQKMAMDWIIEHACRARTMSYERGDHYETVFNEGRRFAGHEIARLVSTDIEKLKQQIKELTNG